MPVSPSHDVIFRNLTLYDGSGNPPVETEVAVDGDRISRVGSVDGDATLEIDAEGQALAPGFIDVHTHDDFAAILHPDMAFKLLGGVTTCVVGNCGMGAAPHRAASVMAKAFHPKYELPDWEGHAGYFDLLERTPPAVNIAALVGHGTLRIAAMGGAKREPTSVEMQTMKDALHEGLDAGVVGLSTGLIYEPGRYAQTDEIVELAAEMADTGALYATHMRDEGAGLLESIREAIEIGERAHVPVQISHHKASGRENWGKVNESLKLIEEAQARGQDVFADQYPYTAGSTILAAIVQNGGFRTTSGPGGGLGRLEPGDVVIASTRSHPQWEGRSIEDLSAEWSLVAAETADRVLAEEPMATIIIHSMSEEDILTVMRHPSTMTGSDGIPSLDGKPHPRLYGTFARVLGHYAREIGVFSLQEAIYRMTGFPAGKFGLSDRGVVREGAFADLVVFDPSQIIDVGTYADPKRSPAGLSHVFVNGQEAARGPEQTPARAGRPIRRMGL